MIFKESLKSIFMATFLMHALFYIQPVYAMDGEIEESPNPWGIHKIYKKALDFIGKGEQSFEPGLLSFKSQIPFFVGLGEDETLYIISQLCRTEQALKELSPVALTCKAGYQLTQHPYLWETLKKTYFNHLPEEYIGMRIEAKNLPPRALARDLLQQLAYQPQEIKRLKDILQSPTISYRPIHLNKIDKDDPEAPFKHIPVNVLRKLSKELRRDIKRLGQLEEKSNIFFKKEEILEKINEKLICECLKHIAQQTGPAGPCININLRNSITRLSLKAIEHIREKILLAGEDTTIRISLACNELRSIPKKLFFIEKIHILDLRNNRLTFLPHSIKNLQENITELLLGNYKAYYLDENYFRVQGNMFKKVPSSILNLRKLVYLDLRSVGLCEFAQEKIYAALPKLLTLNLDLNNLKILPQCTDKKRTIAITTMGNSLKTLDWHTARYVYDNYLMAIVEGPLGLAFFCFCFIYVMSLVPIELSPEESWICSL